MLPTLHVIALSLHLDIRWRLLVVTAPSSILAEESLKLELE